MSECVFCKVARRELPAEIVEEDARAMAFRDSNPQAPVHLLVIPKKHIPALDKASEEDGLLLGHLLLMANRAADSQDLGSDYRVVINTGSGAGQSVFHLHLHVLGGRAMRWPPG